MVARVRPAASAGDNVTDETRVEALGALTATFNAVREAAEVLATLRAEHSSELKKWKNRGIRLSPMKRVIKERHVDPYEVLRDLHEETRLRALTNMPSIQQDLMGMWQPIDVPADKKAEVDRMRWRDDGAFSGREGSPREANPHEAGSEAFACWDKGWLEDQTRIAKAMGAGTAPAVDTSKTKPAAKNGTGTRRRRAAPAETAAVH